VITCTTGSSKYKNLKLKKKEKKRVVVRAEKLLFKQLTGHVLANGSESCDGPIPRP
jgi:hypothetical protein